MLQTPRDKLLLSAFLASTGDAKSNRGLPSLGKRHALLALRLRALERSICPKISAEGGVAQKLTEELAIGLHVHVICNEEYRARSEVARRRIVDNGSVKD
eukprot:scaffold1954_cov268-Pinguiococcus_pyrenoidosus.AAC.139